MILQRPAGVGDHILALPVVHRVLGIPHHFDVVSGQFNRLSFELHGYGGPGGDRCNLLIGKTVDAASATSEYSTQLNNAAKNMESLNALYAVQLENTNAQVNLQNNIMEQLGATAEDSEKLASEISRLSQNLGNLNTVYGNMLSAMNFSK